MGSHPTESLCTFIHPKRGTVQTPEAFRPHGSTERTRNHTAANRTCAWSTLKCSQGIPNECHQLDLINKPCQPGRSCEFVLVSTSRHTHKHQAWVHHAQGHHLPSGSQRPLKVSPGIFTGNTVCKALMLHFPTCIVHKVTSISSIPDGWHGLIEQLQRLSSQPGIYSPSLVRQLTLLI